MIVMILSFTSKAVPNLFYQVTSKAQIALIPQLGADQLPLSLEKKSDQGSLRQLKDQHGMARKGFCLLGQIADYTM